MFAAASGVTVRRIGRHLLSLHLRPGLVLFLFFAVGALLLHADCRCRPGGKRPLDYLSGRHAHHGIRPPIGFLLVRIRGLTDREFRLDGARSGAVGDLPDTSPISRCRP
jgi:hypothetical protein